MKRDFLEQMAERYRRRGFRVFGLAPGLRRVPEEWAGPFPDLYAEKGSRRLVSLVRGVAELEDPKEPVRIRRMLANRGVRVRVFVFSPRALRAARRMRRRVRGFFLRRRVEIFWVRRVRHRVEERSAYNFRRTLALQTKVLAAAVAVGVLLLAYFYFVPPLYRGPFPLDIEKGYRPRDVERESKEIREQRQREIQQRRKETLRQWQGQPFYE